MGIKTRQISKNDSLPSIEYTFSRTNCTTPNLTNYTANFKVRESDATSNSFSLSVTSSGSDDGQITDPEASIVRFDFSTDRFPSTGTFDGEISLENSAGKIETALDRQAIIIRGEF